MRSVLGAANEATVDLKHNSDCSLFDVNAGCQILSSHDNDPLSAAEGYSNLSGVKGLSTVGVHAVRGALERKAAKEAGERSVSVHDIVRYGGTKAPGLEKHHGVLDVWAKANVEGYATRGAPAVVLTKDQHEITRAVYRDWLEQRTGKRVGGRVDWGGVSPREAQALTNRMFGAAKVPTHVQNEYVRHFNRYVYGR